MADLISQANRLNDVEINNSKPVASSVFRRIGSNLNFLLDFLSINDGDTSPAFSVFNQFSAVQTLSISATLTNANVGTPVNLFTFSGNGTRRLFFYENNGSNYSPPMELLSGLSATPELDESGRGWQFPVRYILKKLATQGFNGSGTNGSVVARVRVDGVDFGRLLRASGGPQIQYLSEVVIAPAGEHTVSVLLEQSTTGTPSASFSGTVYVGTI